MDSTAKNPAQKVQEETQTTPAKGLEGIDLEALRVSQDFVKQVGVKKLLTTVPVKKPNRQDFVRVHPDSSYRLDTMLLNLKEEREVYLVAPELRNEMPGELTFTRLALAVNRQNVYFLWQLRLPDQSGKIDAWSLSALEAMDHAQKSWVRVSSNMFLGAYEIFEALGTLSEPEWLKEPMGDLVQLAFRSSYIDSLDHPVLQRLRGEN